MPESQSENTRLIVPLISGDPCLHKQVDRAIERGADLVELRMDLIGDIAAVEDLLRRPRSIPYILTIRLAEEGGGWDEGEDERIALFERLGLLMPGYIDVEYAAWMRSEKLRLKIGLLCDTGNRQSGNGLKNMLILSQHDFRRTPMDRELGQLLLNMRKVPAAVHKIACYAAEASDGLRLLSVGGLGQPDLILMGMGEAGICTRIASRQQKRWGTYAALEIGSESAPGQPSIDTMQRLFRWDSINADTRFFGVIGWPVAHSRSPAIHNAAMAADGINGVYVPMPTKPTQESYRRLLTQVCQCEGPIFRGFSVTIPHKEHAFAWLEENQFEISTIARRCGAVNTLIRTGAKSWTGDNTDAAAARALIQNYVPRFGKCRFLILGAGGVARAVLAALLQAGLDPIICNRTDDRARILTRDIGGKLQPWNERTVLDADVVINCTSVGMSPNVEESPYPAASLRRGMIVFDTVYTPANTRLLEEARAAGCTTIDGTEFFLRQAGLQYELWHSRPAPIEVMRSALSI